jgi:flagellar secretion chaperone FliS
MERTVTPYARNSKLAAYQSVSVHGGVANADPHAMVQMLMDAAAERMAIARGCIERGEKGRQASLLHSCVMIVGELRGSLNITEGGALAQNLSDLYDYMIRQLVLANARSEVGLVVEVSRLLEEIRSAWIAIGPEVRKAAAPVHKPAAVNAPAGPA